MNVDRLLNLMLHRRQKRELPFCTAGEGSAAVLGAGLAAVGCGLNAAAATATAALLARWRDASLEASDAGDRVRGGAALEGDTDRGDAGAGPSSVHEPPLVGGGEAEGEAAPLLTCPLTLESGLGSPAPPVGLRPRLPPLASRPIVVTSRPWALRKCSISSPPGSLLGQYGHATCGEAGPPPAPLVAVWGEDVVLGGGREEESGLGDEDEDDDEVVPARV